MIRVLLLTAGLHAGSGAAAVMAAQVTPAEPRTAEQIAADIAVPRVLAGLPVPAGMPVATTAMDEDAAAPMPVASATAAISGIVAEKLAAAADGGHAAVAGMWEERHRFAELAIAAARSPGAAIALVLVAAAITAAGVRRRRAGTEAPDSTAALNNARALVRDGLDAAEVARRTGLARDATVLLDFRRARQVNMPVQRRSNA